jgi:hypothetical protein
MSNSNNYPTITVGQLRRELSNLPDDCEIIFSGLTYSRLKVRGENLVQMEFDEPVYRTEDGRVGISGSDKR